ncbi:hypothetical protein B7P43_G07376, partial [Cryptotermes secundus]
QRRFRTQCGRRLPARKSIRFWNNKLRTTGIMLRVKSGKTRTSEENVSRIRETFQRSLRKSVRAASLQLRTNLHVTCELETGIPKVNVSAGLMYDKLIRPFFFSEKTVTGRSYLDLPELYSLPQLPPQTIFQQEGALPHFCHYVRNHLDREMAERWISRGGPIAWPPRSPDLTPLGFFL